MIDDLPDRLMACEPFLQRLGLSRIRPRQNSTIDIGALQSQRTPVPYPYQNVVPVSQTPGPLHGLHGPWPWSDEEIERNSNIIRSE